MTRRDEAAVGKDETPAAGQNASFAQLLLVPIYRPLLETQWRFVLDR